MREPESQALGELLEERTHLINLAFRMLGSANHAEDVVQQTYVRWFQLGDEERDAIERPHAWLTTVASASASTSSAPHGCAASATSASGCPSRCRRRRASRPSVGAAVDPLDHITLDDSVSMALLVVLEPLTPAERVAFVLHEVFGVPFAEMARSWPLARSHPAARVVGAPPHPRPAVSPPRMPPRRALVTAFRRACEVGDLDALVRILDPDVTSTSDGRRQGARRAASDRGGRERRAVPARRAAEGA